MAANDYTVRFACRPYRLLKPIYPGERGGRVAIERRLGGSPAIPFRGHYLKDREVTPGDVVGALPPNPRSLAHRRPTPARQKRTGPPSGRPGPWRTAGRRALG